jgi:hypothetical protein
MPTIPTPARRAIVLVIILIAIWFGVVTPWIRSATAPTQHAHSIARLTLPDRDLLIVVVPARFNSAGRLALWDAHHAAERVHELISITGTPALAQRPARSAPRLGAEPAALRPAVPHEPRIFL